MHCQLNLLTVAVDVCVAELSLNSKNHGATSLHGYNNSLSVWIEGYSANQAAQSMPKTVLHWGSPFS